MHPPGLAEAHGELGEPVADAIKEEEAEQANATNLQETQEWLQWQEWQQYKEETEQDGLSWDQQGLHMANDQVWSAHSTRGLESLPQLSCLTQLRALVLSGNKIHGSLEALEHCPHLEELDLCQNSLTSLDGLRYLKYLSVLKATMNEISDAEDTGELGNLEDLAQLPNLRVVDLSKNRLTAVPLTAPVLAKLILYRNLLDSTGFLRALPSLIQLDLGRNKLTELDQISEWNPLLTKIFLYENRLASLPELHLPLLTDLWAGHRTDPPTDRWWRKGGKCLGNRWVEVVRWYTVSARL
eukprot:g28289.t1